MCESAKETYKQWRHYRLCFDFQVIVRMVGISMVYTATDSFTTKRQPGPEHGQPAEDSQNLLISAPEYSQRYYHRTNLSSCGVSGKPLRRFHQCHNGKGRLEGGCSRVVGKTKSRPKVCVFLLHHSDNVGRLKGFWDIFCLMIFKFLYNTTKTA